MNSFLNKDQSSFGKPKHRINHQPPFVTGCGRFQFLSRSLRLAVLCASLLLGAISIHAAPGGTTNDPFFNTSNQVGACGNSYGFGSCTANDFRITSISLSNIVDSCISDTDYFQADVTVEFSKAQPIRYDVMAYFYRGEESGDPFNLTTDAADDGIWCTRVGLNNNLPILDAGVDTLLRTGDIDDEDNDTVTGDDPDSFCFDAPSGAANATMDQTEFSMVLPCRDGDSNGIVDIATCTGWAQNDKGICSGPEYDGITEPQNGTGSKCNCGQFDTNPAIAIPDISITKSCAGDGLGGTNAPDEMGNYAPGDVVECEIIISNSGGTLDAATMANQEGFFYIDDYDESNGVISSVSVVNSSGSVDESFSDSSTNLSIYPDDILNGGTVTINYLFTVDATSSFNQVSEDIPNEVCPYYYDSTNMSATLNGDNCANDTITTTPVTLSDFSATTRGSSIDIEWSTATETSNLGFNIYGQFGQSRIKLNDNVVMSQAVNSLEVLDYKLTISRSAAAGAKEFYLEDIDLQGVSTIAGPFGLSRVKPAKRVNSKKTDWEAIGFKNKGQNQKSQKSATSKRANADKAKNSKGKDVGKNTDTPETSTSIVSLEVDNSGLIKVSSSEFAEFGFSHQDLTKGYFELTDTLGNQVASLYQSTSGNAGDLLFLAKVERTFYAESNRFTLKKSAVKNAAVTMRAVDDFTAAAGANDTFYIETSSVSTDAIYHLGSTVDSDPWMLQRLIAFGANTSEVTTVVPLDNVAVDADVPVVVSAQMLGAFDPEGRQDRIFGLSVDGVSLDSQPGSGLRVNNLQGQFTLGSVLTELPVTVSALQTNDFGVDLSYLNSVAVSYPRQFVSRNGSLEFSSANAMMTVSGLPSGNAKVFATVEDDVIFIGEFETNQGVVEFSGIESADRYWVVADTATQAANVTSAQVLNVSAIQASSLVIAHPQFIGEELTQYIEWRDATLGSITKLVTTDDVYCSYSGCVRSALALKQFIADVDSGSEIDSVMLVGGDVYDYHNNLGVGAVAFVPTLYARTGDLIGFAPVDALFGDVDDDGVPDVAVGRLPVRTNDELVAVLNKSVQFGDQRGKTSAVLTADEQTSTSAYDFANSGEQVAQILSDKGWSLNRQYLDDYLAQDVTGMNRNASIEQARQGVFSALNAGPRLSIYTGHSSAISWSFSKLFDYTSATQLNNEGSPSLYLQWGCYNTYYSHPTTESMSHGLLLAGEQGAALVIGASSLTNAVTEEQFAQLIQSELVSGTVSAGQAMVTAKQRLVDENGIVDLDILWSVTLLGDPELRL